MACLDCKADFFVPLSERSFAIFEIQSTFTFVSLQRKVPPLFDLSLDSQHLCYSFSSSCIVGTVGPGATYVNLFTCFVSLDSSRETYCLACSANSLYHVTLSLNSLFCAWPVKSHYLIWLPMHYMLHLLTRHQCMWKAGITVCISILELNLDSYSPIINHCDYLEMFVGNKQNSSTWFKSLVSNTGWTMTFTVVLCTGGIFFSVGIIVWKSVVYVESQKRETYIFSGFSLKETHLTLTPRLCKYLLSAVSV